MSVSVFTWNINHDVKQLAVGEYAHFSWEARRDAVVDVLRRNCGPTTVACIQEATQESMGDLVRLLFQPATYIVHSAMTNPGHGGMYAFTAVPRTLASVVIQCAIAPPPGGADMRAPWCVVWMTIRGTSQDFVVCNTHMPMGDKYRLPLSLHLATELARTPTHDFLVVCGDMNTFPDAGGYEQVRSMLMACPGLYDATSLMVSPTGERALTTFKPFPFDDGMPANVIPYNLDHIMVRINKDKVRYTHTIPLCHNDVHVSDHFAVQIDFY